MEFKVWIDGVQHVVCGVTGTTTCQDVIAAVARVTERTGSFIMLEISYRKQVFVRASDYLLKRLKDNGYTAQFLLIHGVSTVCSSTINAVCIRKKYSNQDDKSSKWCSQCCTVSGCHSVIYKSLPFKCGIEFESVQHDHQLPTKLSPYSTSNNCSAKQVAELTQMCATETQMSRKQLIQLLLHQNNELTLNKTMLSTLISEFSLLHAGTAAVLNNIETLNENIRQLTVADKDIDDQLQELELVSWLDKLNIETQKNMQLEHDLAVLQAAVILIDEEIKDCKSHNNVISSDIGSWHMYAV
jgi:hypothetical protein